MKIFIWIIGKPGSGKSTVGNLLAAIEGVVHLSYGRLLKEIQPNPTSSGYSMEDRKKVNEIIIKTSKTHSIVVVDGNPYSKIGFGFLDQIEKSFDQMYIFHLCVSDDVALSRLEKRNREVLAHDGASQKERVDNFNNNLLPLIEGYKRDGHRHVTEIVVTDMETGEIVQEINQALKEL